MVALILAFVFTGEVETVLKEAGVASIKTQYGVNSPAGIAVTQAWDFTHVAVSFSNFRVSQKVTQTLVKRNQSS